MKPYHEFEIYQKVHSYAKIYPNLTKLFMYHQPTKVRVAGFEARNPKLKQSRGQFSNPSELQKSLQRTKTKLSDLVICNDFDLFCTFTFKKDRQNVDRLKSQMSNWLKMQRKIHGSFEYVIVPEFHKDGASIHFHALFRGYKGQLLDTGHKTKRKQVSYEIKSYRLGFSTAVKIDNIEKVSSYIRKYITKDMPQFGGKKRYWCSHGLIRPRKITNPVIFPSQLDEFQEHQTAIYRVLIAQRAVNLMPEASSAVRAVAPNAHQVEVLV